MNAYDEAHNLARVLKTSEEYRNLLDAKKQLDADPKNKEILNDLRRMQWEFETDRVLEKEVDAAKQQRMEQLFQLVSLNPTLKDYMGAEYRFARLMGDIQKILADALSEWFAAAEEIVSNRQCAE